MKKSHLILVLSMILSTFIGQTAIAAESPWKSHQANKEVAQTATEEEGVGKIYIGHCSYDEYIYPYDGLSLEYDARVGVGIKLPRNMFKDYIGGKIVAVRAGWDDEATDGYYECFVRTESFTGTDLATGKGAVSFGWNEIPLNNSVAIPPADALYVGFYTNLQKNVCSIPFVYPYTSYDTTNCCYLHVEGDVDETGNERWINMSSEYQPMAIVLVVEDTEGKFSNIVVYNSLRSDIVVSKDVTGTGIISITNKGTNSIESIEITTSFGEYSSATEIELSSPIEQEHEASLIIPVHCFGSGEHSVTISKINSAAPKESYSQSINLIGVPTDVAENYTFRPVVQFFGSENSYMIPTYFDEYFFPGFELFENEMTLICPHSDDKFQTDYKFDTNDNDTYSDALNEIISLCGDDRTKVFIPSTTINRSDYLSCPAPLEGTPFHYGIILEDFIVPLYEEVLTKPTFASIDIETSYNEETKQATVKVFGDVAEGIMPEGEPLYLTVYLMEKDVESWDQMFWDEKAGEVPDPELYVHKNVIREILTYYWGDELQMNGANYEQTFTIDIDTEAYKGENLYIAAFLNRGEKNHHLQRQIINSDEASLNIESGINEVNSDNANIAIETVGGQVLVNGQVGELYNLAGSRIINNNVAPGIYIVKAVVNGETVARKLVVK